MDSHTLLVRQSLLPLIRFLTLLVIVIKILLIREQSRSKDSEARGSK